jgi:hypothetical protein
MRILGSLVPVTIVACVAWGPSEAAASHLRYAHMHWDQASSNSEVVIHVRIAERETFRGQNGVDVGELVDYGTLRFGDGSSTPLRLQVKEVFPDHDFFIAEGDFPHVYPSSTGVYTAEWSSCCTLSTLNNSPDSDLRAFTVIDRRDGNKSSPVPLNHTMIPVGMGRVRYWGLEATDPKKNTAGDVYDTDTFTVSLASPAEARIRQPSGMSVTPTTGGLRWDTAGRAPGLWMTSVKLTDARGAVSSVAYLLELSDCAEILALADARTDEATAHQSRTEFSRDEYLLWFKAVECRTGVPARVLKPVAFSEGLGNQYADATPRHFLEPCLAQVNDNGSWYFELYDRYYGATKPLIAVGRWAYRNAAKLLVGPSYTVPDPRACALPPPTGWPNPGWASVVPVTVGDDRDPDHPEREPTLGLGIMQITFLIERINQATPDDRPEPYATTIVANGSYSRAPYQPLYAYGATHDDRCGAKSIEPMADLASIVQDPQFNILMYAQMVLFKWQFTCVLQGNAGGSCINVDVPREDGQCTSIPKPGADTLISETIDSRYRRILTANPPGVAGSPDSEELWIAAAAQGKTIPGKTQEEVRDFIRAILGATSWAECYPPDEACFHRRGSSFANAEPVWPWPDRR